MVGCNSGRATPFLRRNRPSTIPNHQPRRNATYHSREAVQTTEASSDDRPRATSVDDAVTIRRETPAPLKKQFEIFGRRGSTNRPKTSLMTDSKTHHRQ